MKHNKTLVILTPGFPKDEDDTNSIPFPQAFVKNLQQVNPDIHVIILTFQYPFSVTPYCWNDVKVFPFNGSNKGGLHRLLTWRSVLKKLAELVSKHNVIGLLSLWLGECALVAKYAARKYKLRHFTWMLGQDARNGNRYVKWIRPVENELIALSDSIADEFFKNYNVKPAYTIQLGIDEKTFPTEVKARGIDIIGVGSLIPLKQFEIFITVVEKLVKQGIQLKTVICGDGPERKNLDRLIHDNLLADYVTLRGELPHEEILKLMRSSKILLHPSSYEGFSTVCAEALFTGTHVVSFHKPMRKGYEHMHIAANENEMTHVVMELLSIPELDHSAVLVMPIQEVCRQILMLYKQ